MKKCYYEVLGLQKPSNEDEVRKAYKKMALKWHPDKNPDNQKEAEEKFKEVGEAYAVLSDKNKKEVYDRYGHEGLEPGKGSSAGPGGAHGFPGFGAGFSFHSAQDLFDNLFTDGFFDDDDDFFGSAFGRKKSSGKSKGKARDPFGAFGGFGSAFDDDFGAFGGFGGGGGFSKSTSTSTVMRDGKQVTVKKVTTVNPDGSKTTEVTETVNDGRNTTTKQYIEDGSGQRKEAKTIKHK